MWTGGTVPVYVVCVRAQEDATPHSMRSVVLEVLSSRCTALGVPQPTLQSQARSRVGARRTFTRFSLPR